MKKLVNMQLITNEIHIKNNNLADGQFGMIPKVSRSIKNIDKEHAAVELVVEIINTEEHPFPVDIRVSMTGIFDISKLPEESIDNFLKIQSVHLIFPYIRALISSTTAGSLYPPVVLPVIDASTMFSEEETQ